MRRRILFTMKFLSVLAIVLALASAEIYFQEKFDEGSFFVVSVMGRL